MQYTTPAAALLQHCGHMIQRSIVE